MIKDIVVVDNALENPYELVDFARKQNFYDLEEHYDSICDKVYWNGYRTKVIRDQDIDYINKINEELLTKCILQDQPPYRTHGNYNFRFNWKCNSYFHIMEEKNVFNESWIHNDICNFASVLYLSPEADPKFGTKIFKPGKEITVENVFNRLVMYRGDYMHTSLGGFGEGVNSRLTFINFYGHLKFNIFMNFEQEKQEEI